ncbi:MAG: DUF3990 domain-containing protein [Bacteroidales bacterium]|jgi:hypothetical protein|nr:DUF3990 domain-containing protein [Bacteroidales bacterium]
MKLYHGSMAGVEMPDLNFCRDNTDFGKAFYTTTNFEQAEKWAKLKQKRANSPQACVTEYDFGEELLKSDKYRVRHFEGANKEWLEFIVNNRRGIESSEKYDFVTGPVANDSLYATILLYEQRIINTETAIEQLKTYILFDQMSFHSERALSNLQFVKTIIV